MNEPCTYYTFCKQNKPNHIRKKPRECYKLLDYIDTRCHIPILLEQSKLVLEEIKNYENLETYEKRYLVTMMSWFLLIIGYNIKAERK